MSIHQISKDEKPIWIDKVDPDMVYLGYPIPGAGKDEAKCGIEAISTTSDVITFQYPSKSKKKTFVWDNRSTYTYE